MWKMLQISEPDDLVIGTGEVHTVRELLAEAFKYVGFDYRKFVVIDQRFIRPTETGPLVADYKKAKRVLKWKPKITFKKLVRLLVDSHIARLR